ncbi:MAG TPA: response regulator [Chryseosolibacter sp.]|jgi:CheY-like chemotaxis protein|nr:response regulator [Chryseosolibacter sp.]
MTILAVDDDDEDIEIFVEAMRDIDPSILCLIARSADEALQILNADIDLPSYIFLDINMPKIDGNTCLREIKNDKRFSQIPVIMYSTYNGTKEVEAYKKLGAGYLPKQNSYGELIGALRKVLKIER